MAKLREADLVLFPELYIAGYPPEDLVLRGSFVLACKAAAKNWRVNLPRGHPS